MSRHNRDRRDLAFAEQVAKRFVQPSVRQARPPRPGGQTSAAFTRNHAKDIGACNFLHIHDVLVRPLFALFFSDLGSRHIVLVGVMRARTDAWGGEHFREGAPFGLAPWYFIRDNATYGAHFDAVVAGTRIQVLPTPIKPPPER